MHGAGVVKVLIVNAKSSCSPCGRSGDHMARPRSHMARPLHVTRRPPRSGNGTLHAPCNRQTVARSAAISQRHVTYAP